MGKLDYKKEYKDLYRPPKNKFTIVDVPSINYLMIDGRGDPNVSESYQLAVSAIYSCAYAIKFQLKSQYFDYVVPPLEGLWWMENMAEFSLDEKDRWLWTMMILQPEHVTREHLATAKESVREKKPNPHIDHLRLETYSEGLSAQVLYFGPYAAEGPTIAALHDYIHEQGYQRRGKHHEIYLSDPRRTAPEKLKTVIRQPIQPPS